MAVNDANVRRIINETIQKYKFLPGTEPIVEAFRDLQTQRRMPGGSRDEDLAAAEHFMFARAAVGTGSVSRAQMEVMVVTYGSAKAALQAIGQGHLMQTTSNPTAAASAASIHWGLLGALMGVVDRKTHHPDVVPPVFNNDILRYGSKFGAMYD